jgi:hypothetical protein
MSKSRLRYPDYGRDRMKFGKAKKVPCARLSRLRAHLGLKDGYYYPELARELRMISWRRYG